MIGYNWPYMSTAILKTKLVERDGQFTVEAADISSEELINKYATSLIESSIDHVEVLINILSYLVTATGVDQLWLWIPTQLGTDPDWSEVGSHTDYRLVSHDNVAWLVDNHKLEDRSHTYPETTQNYAPIHFFINMLGEAGSHYGGVLVKVMAGENSFQPDILQKSV